MADEKVSIIIPVKEINDYIRESLPHIEKLNYNKKNIEVIILPDYENGALGDFSFDVNIIPTGHIHPGEKRDIGIKKSKGSIIAFIDDDVYPSKEWLKRAVEIFQSDESAAAVGGPAVTPSGDSFLQKVSGLIYSSFLGGGSYKYRYVPQSRRYVDDYPSCNLIIRRDVLDKIGGFNTEFWPGEDTVICLKIIRDLKMKIVYGPGVKVFHHRRKFFRGHIKQVKSYATHRGYFVKKFPETSFRLSYFVPTFFVLYLFSFLFPVFFAREILTYWAVPFFVYLMLLVYDGVKTGKYLLFVMAGIFLTHVYYGVYFMAGLAAKKLKEENQGKGKSG